MTVHKTSIPFNKDTAPVSMLKQATDNLEMLFEMVERFETNPDHYDDPDARIAGMVRQIYDHWKQKYPVKSA